MRLPPICWFGGWPCQAGTCVEVAALGGGVGVRDSKDPDGPTLWFSREEWAVFLAGAKAGQFDHLA